MHTVIHYQSWSGGSVSSQPTFIGYCVESPIVALSLLSKNYAINRFKNVCQPVDKNFPNNALGIVIQESMAPEGTTITGCLNDLLSKGLFKDAEISGIKRDEKVFSQSLLADLKLYFSDYKQMGESYLYLRDIDQNPYKEKMLFQLREIADAILGIQDIDGLKDFWESQTKC